MSEDGGEESLGGEGGMHVQSAEGRDGGRDRRWRAVVSVVERARSTGRAADTQRQRQILRPTHHPRWRGRETEWATALRAPAYGDILTGWGFPHCVRETSPSPSYRPYRTAVSGLWFQRHLRHPTHPSPAHLRAGLCALARTQLVIHASCSCLCRSKTGLARGAIH